MRNMHTVVGSTLFATLVALTGCDAQVFANVNSSLMQVKTASKSVGSPVVPAASIAATVGGIALAKVMATKSSSLIAAGGGNLVAAGAGNLVAAGAGNYELMAEESLPDEYGVTNIKLNYVSEAQAGRTLKSKITKFSCKSQGYDLFVSGDFEFTQGESVTPENAYILFQSGSTGSIKAAITGDVKYLGKVVVKIQELSLNFANPVPDNGPIGSFKMESEATGDDYVLIKADAKVVNKVIQVTGTSKVGKNGPEKAVTFGEGNLGGDAEAEATK